MVVRLNQRAYDHARELIAAGRCVIDDRDAWSEHQPSAADENAFIDEHGWAGYGRWHLAVDDEANRETKGHYKFPYGDFSAVHRCAVLAAESRAVVAVARKLVVLMHRLWITQARYDPMRGVGVAA